MAEGKQVNFIANALTQAQLDDLCTKLELKQSAVLRLAVDRLWVATFGQSGPQPTQANDKGGEKSPPIGE